MNRSRMNTRNALIAAVVLSCPIMAGKVLADQILLEQDMIAVQQFDQALLQPMPMPRLGQLRGFEGDRSSGLQVAGGGVAIEDTAAAEAYEHFQNEDWFKAISAIENLGETEDDQLVADPTGVYRPVSSLRRSMLEALPEEGRQTFRQMNSAAAATKLEEALKMESLDARTKALEYVLNRFTLCDAAAVAASRLGDLRFEAGRFDEANDLYTLAAEHVGATPDDPKLMAKRLHSLARSGRWAGFDKLAEYAAFRHKQETVKLGGKPVSFADLIETLRTHQGSEVTVTSGDGMSLPLPAQPHVTYAIEMTDPENRAAFNMNSSSRRRQYNQYTDVLHPSVLAGPDQFFTLHLNTVTAYEAATGSMQWEQGDAKNAAERLSQNSYYLQMDYQQQMIRHEDLLLVTNADVESPTWSRLRAIDTNTGEVKWRTKDAAGLNRYSIVGMPIVRGQFVYATARQDGGNELKLITINLVTGAMGKVAELGTLTPDRNWSQPVDANPRMTFGERYLMVLTNNGGILAVDPETMKVGWAFAYPMLPTERNRRGGGESTIPGDLRIVDGVVYFKDTRDDQLHAIREHDGTRLWSVKASTDTTIVHADLRHLYTTDSRELVAWDLESAQRVWWTPHAGSDVAQPLFTEDACLLLGTSRACRIDLATGKVTAFRDDLAVQSQIGRFGSVTQSGSMIGFADRDSVRVFRLDDNSPASGDLTP